MLKSASSPRSVSGGIVIMPVRRKRNDESRMTFGWKGACARMARKWLAVAVNQVGQNSSIHGKKLAPSKPGVDTMLPPAGNAQIISRQTILYDAERKPNHPASAVIAK